MPIIGHHFALQVTGQVASQIIGEVTSRVTGLVTGESTTQVTGQATGQVKIQVTGQVTGRVTNQVTVCAFFDTDNYQVVSVTAAAVSQTPPFMFFVFNFRGLGTELKKKVQCPYRFNSGKKQRDKILCYCLFKGLI
jgi:hypothetical protein